MMRFFKSVAAMVRRSGTRPTSLVRQARPQVEGLEERLALSGTSPLVGDTFYLWNPQARAIDTFKIVTVSPVPTRPSSWTFTGAYTDSAHHYVDAASGSLTVKPHVPTPAFDIAFSGYSSGFVRQGVSFHGTIGTGISVGSDYHAISGLMDTSIVFGSIVVRGLTYGLAGSDESSVIF